MVPEPLRRLHCKTSRESLPFPIPLYSIYDEDRTLLLASQIAVFIF